jgi:hypothetical protein
MSVSSNIRKESTESNAAQQMHSTMGNHPDNGLSQLNELNQGSDLPTRLNDQANNTSVAEDVETIKNNLVDSEESESDQPTHVADADWNRSTAE